MVDLHLGAGARSPHERHEVPGVGVGQGSRDHKARLQRVEHDVVEPDREDVVAGVAPVPVDVGPGLPEELPLVVGQAERLHDRQRRQVRPCGSHQFGRHRVRRRRPHLRPPLRHYQRKGEREQPQHGDGRHRPRPRRLLRFGQHVPSLPARPGPAPSGPVLLWTTRPHVLVGGRAAHSALERTPEARGTQERALEHQEDRDRDHRGDGQRGQEHVQLDEPLQRGQPHREWLKGGVG